MTARVIVKFLLEVRYFSEMICESIALLVF